MIEKPKHNRRIPLAYVAMMTSAAALVLIIGAVALFSPSAKVAKRQVAPQATEGETRRSRQITADAQRDIAADSRGNSGAENEAAGDPGSTEAGDKDVNVAARTTPIADDGKTQWASPTDGAAISLEYLPPGAEVILAVRLSELLEAPEGDKLRAALGPWGETQLALLEQATGVAPREVEQVVVGVRAERDEQLAMFGLVQLRAPLSVAEVKQRFADWRLEAHQDVPYHSSDGQAVYLPQNAPDSARDSAPEIVVFGSVETVREVIEAQGASPGLGREMEALWANSDTLRHVNLLVATNFVQRDGRALLGGRAAPLKEWMQSLFGDQTQAALLSTHLGEEFFLELRAAGSLDVRPVAFGEKLADRLHAMPQRAEAYVVSLNPQPYGRLVLYRLPQMVKLIDRFTRLSIDRRQVVMRCFLPSEAAHNLLFALELALVEHDSMHLVTAATAPATPKSETVADRLKRKITVAFDQDTLESAVQMMAEASGVEIEIAGGDLQLDGITKNQSFGMDVRDKPAGEVLLTIMRLANPDKTAKNATEPAQKLVYVIRPGGAGGEERIVVTTRAQAKVRQERLPAVFRLPE